MDHRRRARCRTMHRPIMKMAQMERMAVQPMDIVQHHRTDCCLRDSLCIPTNQITIWFTTNTVHTADHSMNCPSKIAFSELCVCFAIFAQLNSINSIPLQLQLPLRYRF